MKAFVSYSLNNTEKYMLSLLSKNLHQRCITVVSSYSSQIGPISFSANQIRGCQFFIGIVSYGSLNKYKVLEEWRIARSSRIPSLLLIEDRVKINSIHNAASSTVVRFNRSRPDFAIDKVNERISLATRKIVTKKNNNDETAWVLGGGALLLLLALLGSNEKK